MQYLMIEWILLKITPDASVVKDKLSKKITE